MTLSLPFSAAIRQFLPGIYFMGVIAYVIYDNHNLWLLLFMVPFIFQMLLNNRYLNLVLGILTILWSVYMGFAAFMEVEPTVPFMLIALSVTIVNLYMSRMLFLNQNFTMAALRENSLDETLFI
ncbi:MAG: hypothetical protein H7Y13_13045 [Sphingobacteriaceae bacterium]|nr:hypothetical protein [Sphingobacteriaceae bacterium]